MRRINNNLLFREKIGNNIYNKRKKRKLKKIKIKPKKESKKFIGKNKQT